MRCIEGFIKPLRGESEKKFKSRTEIFIGSSHHKLMGEIYESRSKIEHMHTIAEKGASNSNEDEVTLSKHAYIAEGIARYLINTFFNNQKIRSSFINDNQIDNFWKMSDDQRRLIWGQPFDLCEYINQFSSDKIKNGF